MCTDADCNFVISGDASKSGFHIWPMLHVCLFKRTKKKIIKKKNLCEVSELLEVYHLQKVSRKTV